MNARVSKDTTGLLCPKCYDAVRKFNISKNELIAQIQNHNPKLLTPEQIEMALVHILHIFGR
jgi:hypothetical protein